MTTVRVSRIEEAEAVFMIAVQKKPSKRRGAQPGLVRASPEADRPGAHGKAAGFDAGVAENNFILGAEFSWKRFRVDECGTSYPGSRKQCGA
jgi:hypothetical protein